jgi:hypothetical protein
MLPNNSQVCPLVSICVACLGISNRNEFSFRPITFGGGIAQSVRPISHGLHGWVSVRGRHKMISFLSTASGARRIPMANYKTLKLQWRETEHSTPSRAEIKSG